MLPGIVLLRNAEPTRRQQIAAALTYGGPDAVITGGEACRAFGFRDVPDTGELVHLLVPHGRRLHNYDYVQVERTHRMPTVRRRGNLPLAEPTRAVLDATRRLTELRPARALLTEAVQRSFTTLELLNGELAKGSRRGSAVPRTVLMEMSVGTESVAEIDAARVWEKSGLPAPVWNRRLVMADGRFIAKPDAWFDAVGLAWEIDSLAFHLGAAGFDRTIARNGRYTAAGILVLQTLPSRLRSEPQRVIAELRAAYAAAAARPRPDVRLAA